MHKPHASLSTCLMVLGLTALTLLAVAPVAHAAPRVPRHINPVIFVHGGFGSAAQFESQAMRFASNGYPVRWVRGLDYDSSFGVENMARVHDRLDALIARTKRDTGRSKVELVGHSLGTRVSQSYLSSPQRAANVARYVNVDGATAGAPPGGVPTLAIWSGLRLRPGSNTRAITGARNVTIPNQTHVQVATSVESFRHYFRFLTRRRARSGLRAQRGPISLAGRAVLFPQNVGASDVTLRIYEVDGLGRRARRGPVARPRVRGDGSWGPVRRLRRDRRYEFALSRPTGTHHLYYEPFPRSDYLVRLLTSEPNNGADLLIEKSPRHSAVVALRYKEFWGDRPGQNDRLRFNRTNVVNANTSPVRKTAISVFAMDRRSDARSDLSRPIPVFGALPFLTGVDLFLPSSSPTTGTVRARLRSRSRGPVRDLSFPNFPSSTDRVSLQWHDFE